MIIILLILAALFGPALLFLSIGLSKRKTEPQRAKVFYILSAVYVLISGGICASLVMNFRL